MPGFAIAMLPPPPQIWPADDGQPPEHTSFTDRLQVTVHNLDASAEYHFRVRHRLLHGHGPWSPTGVARTGKADEGRGGGTEEQAEVETEGKPMENIYRLRIVLAPPRSFLVWTSLAEHRNRRIHRFRFVTFIPHLETARFNNLFLLNKNANFAEFRTNQRHNQRHSGPPLRVH